MDAVNKGYDLKEAVSQFLQRIINKNKIESKEPVNMGKVVRIVNKYGNKENKQPAIVESRTIMESNYSFNKEGDTLYHGIIIYEKSKQEHH